jgi:hypothetical protein
LRPRKDTQKKKKIQTEKKEKIKVYKEGYKTRNLSTAERSAIHALVTDGKMIPKDVAKMKNVSLGTVYLLKNSTSFDNKPRTGRPKKY